MGSSSLLEQRQADEKAAWDAYWKLRDLDSRGTIFPRMRYYVHKAFDAPATWFRGEWIGLFFFFDEREVSWSYCLRVDSGTDKQ